MNGHSKDEQTLKVTYYDRYGGKESDRGHGIFLGRGRGRQAFNKAIVECYKCHQLGHFSMSVLNERKKQITLSLRRKKRCC
jgi:hypothetical protein